jgi:hypothetical protein
MLRILLMVLGFGMIQIASAQYCSTPQEALFPRIESNKRNPAPIQRGAIKYIPITYHLVANASGNGRVEEENVLKQHANLQVQFADQEIVWYIDRFNYFDNDAVYNTPGSPAARTQMNLRKDNNSVNIFITNTADDGSGVGVTLAYYDPNGDWIVSRKNEINGASPTIAHELGHFFSVAHTHAGWDCFPFTLDDYTNPVNVNVTKPCENGGGSLLIELHNRSNCNTAGDKLCDTPEDYNLGLLHDPGCDQNTQIMDKNSEVIQPMVDNFMSYYQNCATRQFTPQQKGLINTDYFTIARQYIRTGVTPNTTPVVDPVNYIYPINGEESNGISNIVLDWADVPGANKYIVIYDRFASFTNNPVKTIVSASEFVIPGPLNMGSTYYWKVWPYNETQTGAMYSPTQNFVAGESTGVNEISDVQEYALTPNPVGDQQDAMLTINATQAFAGKLTVVDAASRIIETRHIDIPVGHSTHSLNAMQLPAGIYFVVLNSEKGNLVERLLVVD